MPNTQYLTAPLKTDKMPPGVPYIVGNEAAERFSYYGMNSILVVFMTDHLLIPHDQAEGWYHIFVTCAYILPFLGALFGDAILGKYRTILYVSIIYCFGHFTLAINHSRVGLAIGLSLIAIGAGGIKPCVSANVGDQFGASNQHLLAKVFSWFYFSINIGSAFSTILIPELLNRVGPKVAFGVPGIAMLIAAIVFWSGRKKFVHIPPAGAGIYVRELFQRENLKALRSEEHTSE